MRTLCLAAAIALAGVVPALAGDVTKVEASTDVTATMDALEAAVGKAGATVFARIDHAGGAREAGLELADSQLLIFGNPKLGTPAMQGEPQAGLFLPLKVLVYEDAEGKVWLAYEDPEQMLGAIGLPADAPYLGKMAGALSNLTAAAAGN